MYVHETLHQVNIKILSPSTDEARLAEDEDVESVQDVATPNWDHEHVAPLDKEENISAWVLDKESISKVLAHTWFEIKSFPPLKAVKYKVLI